ncbi:MAG: acyltransferase family protein [Alphaproteobacteria bacterium]
MNLKYRPEIDGLRAIAVIAVIIYHAQFIIGGQKFLSGGYLGVDIFFVISGYLITFIIQSQIQDGSFSFMGFYERRIRRILPALFVVVLASFPIAWMVMLPQDISDYASSILSALVFGSNFWFLQEDSYAAAPSLLKPFLHTWSLSVEEQFYIFFPIILLVINQYFKIYIWHTLIGLFCVSIILAEYGSRYHPDAAFYLLHARGWELLVGAFLAKLELEKGRHHNGPILRILCPVIGLALLAACFVFFDDQTTRHPSLITLLPIIATALIIRFAGGNEPVTLILSSKAFVFVGLISYSLYLWHYPIFAFGRISDFMIAPMDKIYLCVLCIFLSVVTYKFIEQPFRNKVVISRRWLMVCIIGSAIVITSISTFLIVEDGYPRRLPSILANDFNEHPWFRVKNDVGQNCYGTYAKDDFCYFERDENNQTLLVIGDSNVESLSFDLVPRALDAGYNVVTMNSSACYFTPDFYSIKNDKPRHIKNQPCDLKFQNRRLDTIKKHPGATLLLGGALDVYLTADGYSMRNDDGLDLAEHYKKNVQSMLNDGYRVIQMTPTPRFSKLVGQSIFNILNTYNNITPEFLASILSYDQGYYFDYTGDAMNLLKRINHPNFNIVYTHMSFCNTTLAERCVSNDGEHLFFIDLNHPSITGSKKINDMILKELGEH